MSTTESRLSYASSPESDAETGGPEGRLQPRMLRASSDPSVATQQDALDRDELNGGEMAPPPPPYTQSGYSDSKYGFSSNGGSGNPLAGSGPPGEGDIGPYSPPKAPLPLSPPQSPQGLYGHVPELPPRIDRGVKPPGGVLLPGPTPGRNPPTLRHHAQNNNRQSAQERLFGTPRSSEADGSNPVNGPGTIPSAGGTPDKQNPNAQGSLDRYRHHNNNSNSYDSMSSYDSYGPNGLANTALSLANSRLGPNAPDDLKVGPRTDSNNTYEAKPVSSPAHRHSSGLLMDSTLSGGPVVPPGQQGQYSSGQYGTSQGPGQSPYGGQGGPYNMAGRGEQYGRGGGGGAMPPQTRQHQSSGDYSKYTSGKMNSGGTMDYNGSVGKAGGAAIYKPVPPPKPKHYRPPPVVGSSDTPPTPPTPQHAKSYSVGNGGMEMNGRSMHGGVNPGNPGVQNGYGGSPGRGPSWQNSQQSQHAHSMSHPYHHPHQQSMYGGSGLPQAPPYNGPPPHMRSPPHANNAHVIDLAGSREQRGSAFELYRKPQHMHNMSPAVANESAENNRNDSPKPAKKLSKKSSFLRSITIDLFRSKSKKVSKHHSVCESDLQNLSKHSGLRRDESNAPRKPKGLFRSNSSCDNKTPLKPILKRQTSFNDHNKMTPISDVFSNPLESLQMRRQNSLCEIETEPKVKPFLRRQNSLIEYNRRGIYDYQFKPFNVITTIDPLYQRGMEVKHEPYYPGKNMTNPSEPIFQTKTEALCGAVPKPERTYATRSEARNSSIESPYANRQEIIKKQTQCPYSSRQEVIHEQSLMLNTSEDIYTRKQEFRKTYESPYATRNEILSQKESPYASRMECYHKKTEENPYGIVQRASSESPYTTRSEIMKQRSSLQNPYSTKEELLRQRAASESPYGTKEEMLRQRLNPENPYSSRDEILRQRIRSENPYGTREDVMKQRLNKTESPYQTKEEMLRQRLCLENPYSTKEQMLKQRSSCDNASCVLEDNTRNRLSCESPYATTSEVYKTQPYPEASTSGIEKNHRRQNMEDIYSSRKECGSENPYASRQEVLGRKKRSNSRPNSLRLEEDDCMVVNNLATLRIGENPYATKAEVEYHRSTPTNADYVSKSQLEKSTVNDSCSADNKSCTCEDISELVTVPCSSKRSSEESPYVTKQEILSQKAALLANKEMNKIYSDDKFEVIRLRNQAKKEKIYQSRKELGMMEGNTSRDPIYVSKRDLKETVIYESHTEVKEQNDGVNLKNINCRQSPYELSDVAHLSRRECLYQSKQEAFSKNSSNLNPAIDFDTLRNQSKTDQEKQNNLIYESKILHGEPMYQSRLPPKVKFAPQDGPHPGDTLVFNSATSMETHYESECSMQFDCKPQSTPYASQDMERGNDSTIPLFKCNNRSGNYNSSGEGHDTTVVAGPLLLDTELLAVGQKGKIGGPDGPCTTWGIFDSEGGVLEDRSWGVSLLIPPDAILPGVKQKIYFTVSDPRHNNQTTPGPPIDMDKGEALLSPLVMCGPQGLGFARPVTLRLPHCANTLPSLGLTLNATDTEPSAQPSWDNILLPATTTLNTVAVKVDHF